MNFFKRILLKLERKADERKARRTNRTEAPVAQSIPPPQVDQQQTPAALPPELIHTATVSTTHLALDPFRPPEPQEQIVVAPRGHRFPLPDPRENGWGYLGRTAKFLGREGDWARLSGTIMLGTDHLVPKTVPYPDGYAEWKSKPENWPTMAENFWFPEHIQEPDPGWQKVYERMAQERQAAQKPPVPPSTPDQTEIPL